MAGVTLKIDNTKRGSFVACPKKYEWKWVRHIESVKGSTALRYGSAFHGCMEGFYGVIAEKGWTALEEAMVAGAKLGIEVFDRETGEKEFWDDYRDKVNLIKAFTKYVDHFYYDEGMMEILETEKVFKILIKPTPLEEKLYPGIEPFYFTGKMDLEIKLNHRPWIVEFKTTSQPLTLQSLRLHRSPQVIGYNYACRKFLHEIPDGSLIVLHQLMSRKKKNGDYGKLTLDFQRVPEVFSDDDLTSFRLGLVYDAWRIQQAHKNQAFPMNHYSCYTYGQCGYTELCEQNRNSPHLGGNFIVNDDPWTVLKGSEGILVTVEETEEEVMMWQENQLKILN